MNKFFRKLLKLSLGTLCPLLNAAVAPAQSMEASIDSIVYSFMSDRKVPGFAACIVKDESIIWSKGYGNANIDNKVPMSVDGIMNIGSVSKTFTTAAAMQLWEKGLLDLDEDVSKYLDFKVINTKYPDKPITVFQILTHTSSIIDGKAYSQSYSCGDPTMALQDWIYANLTPEGKFFNAGDNFGEWAPGSGQHQYSNVSFGLLGLIVEKIAKLPFDEYCKAFIFEPLGMKHTGWMLAKIDTRKHILPYAYVTERNRESLLAESRLYPTGVDFKTGTFIPACLYSFPNYPDGLVRTSVRELSSYLIAMMNGGNFKGKKILKEETVEKMLSPQIAGDNHQGLTWHIYEWDSATTNSARIWGHTGGDPGITTYLFFDPVSRLGLITFQNASTGGTSALYEALYKTVTSRNIDSTSLEFRPSKTGTFFADKIHWSAENRELLLKGKINVNFGDNNFKGNGSFSGLGKVNLLIINGKKVSVGSSVSTSGKKCFIQALSKQDAVKKYGTEGELGVIEIVIPQ